MTARRGALFQRRLLLKSGCCSGIKDDSSSSDLVTRSQPVSELYENSTRTLREFDWNLSHKAFQNNRRIFGFDVLYPRLRYVCTIRYIEAFQRQR